MDEDIPSAQLIAQLLEEDLRSIEHTAMAERFQLTEVLADTSKGKQRDGGVQDVRTPSPAADVDVALAFVRAEVEDAVLAEALQRADASAVASFHLSQKLAAAERKLAIDAAYARSLQDIDNTGEQDVDDQIMQDVSGVLRKDELDELLAADLHETGEAKQDVKPAPPPPAASAKSLSSPTCNICFNEFTPTASPLSVSSQPSSASRAAYGFNLPCPQHHQYCLSCLRSHILTALAEPTDMFAVRCPECPPAAWTMGDDVAGKLLTESELGEWHARKLLAQRLIYCPNPRCSHPFHLDDVDTAMQAICPACNTQMCTSCRVVWHEAMDCEEYQALPVDEKLPEDRLVLELAKAKNWRRCYNCAAIVELVSGCNHITCKCGTHFCFKCGSPWDGKCTRQPSCDLWDEENLLEANERDRVQAAERRAVNERPRRVEREAPQRDYPQDRFWDEREEDPFPEYHEYHGGWAEHDDPPLRRNQGRINAQEFEWLNDPQIVSGRHYFTTTTLHTLTCGYCHARLNSLADLQYHLANVRHQVYACCGRLFKNFVDFERHSDAAFTRFDGHIMTIVKHPY